MYIKLRVKNQFYKMFLYHFLIHRKINEISQSHSYRYTKFRILKIGNYCRIIENKCYEEMQLPTESNILATKMSRNQKYFIFVSYVGNSNLEQNLF